MRIYTLDYDCNLPVTQQVNVATNTDAKIGIKVKKNGEYLNLDGSTLSVKVGNEIVYDPVTIDGTSAELTASTTTTNTTLSTDVAGSDYYDQNVAAKKIKVQISYDGTTWEDATPLTSDIVGYWYDLNVDSSRPKALINMANPQTFNVVFGPDAGKQLTELAWTEKTRIQMNANQYAYWNITSYPCYMRICADFQKPNYQEMLSADAELTNGYVTFPISIGDEPSLIQDTVVVDKPHSFNGTIKKTGQFPATVSQDEINPSIIQVSAKELDAVGAVVNANDIGPKQIKQWRNANPVPDELSAWNTTTWCLEIDTDIYSPTAVIIEGYIDEHGDVQGKEVYCKQKEGDPTKWVFADRLPVWPPTYVNERETYTLTENSRFVRKLNFKANWYYGQAIDLVLDGKPTKATFKLNLNTFKSQQGDKEYMPELPYIPSKTVTFAGTYSDSTPFSYEVFYKD